jgi:hypothetical protein
MKKMAIAVLMFSLFATSAFAQVRISQVYGGGGATSGSPTYNQDYVELFNAGTSAVDLTGWAVEYGSAAGNWGSTTLNQFVFPSGASIAGCSYLLIGFSSGTVGPAIPTPDYTGTNTMSATSGKVALFNTLNANVACGSETGLQDKVSYGSGNCPEGTNVGTLANTNAAVRNNGGMDDTNDNSADFSIVTGATPRNSSSPPNGLCVPASTEESTWGGVKGLFR